MATVEELQSQIQALLVQVEGLGGYSSSSSQEEELKESRRSVFLGKQISVYRDQLDSLERVFTDLTQRNGILLTLAGLLSFLPAPTLRELDYIRDFLLSIFPLLLLGIFFFFLSSKRIFGVRTENHSIFISMNESELLADELRLLEIIWERKFALFKKTVIYHRLCAISIYLYFIAFITNYYLYIFYFQTIDISLRIITTITLIVLGLWMYLSWKGDSEILEIGKMKNEDLAVGATPPEL